ncbi:uncharacterized protein ACA1_240360 [Acanthamoeba castellanii str. Neff]|uniref:Uncharacterized protein n=1 Tax=Acanthamoeba castellanii (strain ATCC 30010 / Neff) TaxID=1257118 RepID=L8GKJ0_ACACF|nr:uncharacterized protein ACA1_240360 [Acanthamoeba castellanii str. Neff]ELR13359.1 hypothetical protein ACA1_240360 [Acanthamoeba castellanii str. Neff]
MRNLVLLLTTTFILGLLGCVAVEATFADAVASPPLRLAWSCTLALAPGQQAPQVNALVSVNTPVATVTLTGPDWEICLVGLSLDDGTVLWNNSGVEGTYQGQNYTVPYTNAAALRRDALVADFSRVVTLGNLTGRERLSHGLDYDRNSNTVLLSRWEFVYIVKWDYPQNLLLRLQAPDYGLDRPAATHAFPSTNTFGTAPNLFPAPRSGALLHSYLVRNGTRDSLTLERLQPSTLKPLWSIEGFDTAAGIAISRPMEDVVVVTNTTFDAPTWRSQLSAYSLADGSLRFAWPLEWGTPSYVAFSYEGTAHNSSTGAQRMCTSVSTWFSPNNDQRTGLICMDPSTGRVTLNVTLKAEDEKSSRASLMAIYETWALLKDETTGDLLAIDCFDQQTTTAEGTLPKPAWVLPGQRDLVSLSLSEDGLAFMLATYKSGRVARWNGTFP